MDLERLRSITGALPGTVEDVKWGADLCFCVATKMYCVYGMGQGSFSVKTSPEGFAHLTRQPGFSPAPYLARSQWVHVDANATVDDAALATLLTDSYRLIVEKLPKRVQKSLGEGA